MTMTYSNPTTSREPPPPPKKNNDLTSCNVPVSPLNGSEMEPQQLLVKPRQPEPASLQSVVETDLIHLDIIAGAFFFPLRKEGGANKSPRKEKTPVFFSPHPTHLLLGGCLHVKSRSWSP